MNEMSGFMYLFEQHLVWVILALIIGMALGFYFCRKHS